MFMQYSNNCKTKAVVKEKITKSPKVRNHEILGARYLRTSAPKMYPRTDLFLNLPRKKIMIYFCQEGKKLWGHRLGFQRMCPKEHSKSEKIGLLQRIRPVSKPKNIAITFLKKKSSLQNFVKVDPCIKGTRLNTVNTCNVTYISHRFAFCLWYKA